MTNNEQLIEATKVAIGYTPTARICVNCHHGISEDDPFTGRALLCTVSNICSFEVNELATCDKFRLNVILKVREEEK